MKKLNLFLTASFLTLGTVAQENNVQILVGPDVLVEYQVVSMSPNGRWACGNVNDGEGRGFIWDIVNNEITQVAPLGQTAPVLDIANDGTMVGLFTTNEATENGAAIEVGGYFKNGKWHYLPGCVMMNGISDNGQYMAGISIVKGGYCATTWNLAGEATVWDYEESSAYDVSNDGKMACGWKMKYNRTPALWTADSVKLLHPENVGPFSLAHAFSPDGNKIIADQVIYDLTTQTTTPVDFSTVFGYEFYRATNTGNAVGRYTSGMYDIMHAAYVKDGKVIDLQKHLEAMGVDLTGWTLLQCTGVAEDERTFAVNAYDTKNIPHPMIIRLDANLTNPAPTSLKVAQLEDTDVCRLTWKAPLANVEGVKAYNLWRNGEKIAELPASDFKYYDRALANGNYEYAVTAVYADSESEKCESVVLDVADFLPRAPRALSAVQTGIRDVRLFWNAPLANRPALKHSSDKDDVVSFGSGTYNFEQAVRFEAADLAVYGKQITDISFYPMSKQYSWTANFYTAKDTTLFASRKLDDSNLVYGVENTVTLSEPVTVPEGEDIYVGIFVDVTGYGGYTTLGAIFNKCRAGYTDLIRREGEETFMSLYENAMNDEEGAYEYPITFPIGICMGDAAQLADNKVVSYKVYVDNVEVGTTDFRKFRQDNVTDGKHGFSVAAVYSNGVVTEPVSVSLNVVENTAAYKKISNPVLTDLDGKNLKVTWEAPRDDDETLIGYSSETNAGGLASSGNWAVYASSYDKDNFGLYDGYLITHVRFFPTSDADFAIIIKEDDKEVVEQYLERGVDYTVGLWNTIELDEPIVVKAASEYMLFIDCWDVVPGVAALGMDNLTPYKGESDLFSEDGENFMAVSAMENATREGNWMMGLVIRSAESKPLPIEGYNVYVNRSAITESPIAETTITHETSGGSYSVRVDVVYSGIAKPVQGTTRFIVMNAAGIEDVEAAVITLDASETSVTVLGGNVSSVKAYDMTGALVAQTAGATLDIAQLNAGVYVLTAVVDGQTLTRKIQIR